jgi:23S rRNA pseudoU1915 N3-methylase RlmH
LGRGQDLNKLSQFLQYLGPLGPEAIMQNLNLDDYIDRLGASLGIDTGGLIKTPEQKQMEAQQAQEQQEQMMQQQFQQDLIKGVAPNAVKGMQDGMAQNPEMVQEMIASMQK